MLWNEGARRIYGYEPGEVVGTANVSILHRQSDRSAGMPRRMLDTARERGSCTAEVQRVTKDGKIFAARVVVTPRHDAERVLRGYLLVSRPLLQDAG